MEYAQEYPMDWAAAERFLAGPGASLSAQERADLLALGSGIDIRRRRVTATTEDDPIRCSRREAAERYAAGPGSKTLCPERLAAMCERAEAEVRRARKGA